jgi:hypothetical protein
LAWALALVNEDIQFFGRRPTEIPLTQLASAGVVNGSLPLLIPKNLNDVLCIIIDSIALFNGREALEHVASVLGGLPAEFLRAFTQALDPTNNVFSFPAFRSALRREVPVFQLILDIAESGDREATSSLSKLSITVPTTQGSESLTNLVGLSRIFKNVNDTFIAVANSQDNFDRVKAIRAQVALDREREDALEAASSDLRLSLARQFEPRQANAASNLWAIQAGRTVNKKTENVSSANAWTFDPKVRFL